MFVTRPERPRPAACGIAYTHRGHAQGGRHRVRPEARVRAGVAQHLDRVRLDVAVACAAQGRVDHLAPTVVQPDEVLRARLGPPHRALQRTRRPHDEHVLRVAADLRTEATADVRRDHVHLLRLQRKQPGERRLHRVRCLRHSASGAAGRLPSQTDARPGLRAGRPRAAAPRCVAGPRPRSRRRARRGRRRPAHRELRGDVGAHLGEEHDVAAGRRLGPSTTGSGSTRPRRPRRRPARPRPTSRRPRPPARRRSGRGRGRARAPTSPAGTSGSVPAPGRCRRRPR